MHSCRLSLSLTHSLTYPPPHRYLAEKKAREEQQAIEDAKPKRIIQIDDTTAKWKEQKAREKEEQLVCV